MTVDTFRIDLPTSWTQLPADPDEARGMMLSNLDGDEWESLTPTQRRRIELFVERVIVDYRKADPRFVAVLAVPEFESEIGSVMATVFLSVLERSDLQSSLPLTAPVVLTAMGLDRDDDERRDARLTDLEPPEQFEYDRSSGVRLRRLLTFERQGNVAHFYSESYFIVVPDQFEQLLVLQFMTPDHEEASTFSELFNAIARTARMYEVGEPTTL